ncbi:NADP-dependent oxidoreductase [Nocardioides sp. WS12]|uniref:NADP-dependent oxidoreductase n=1 Tax=Nocardioides sp. WS12 TaxID=2486272 RepID=UPI0015FB5585|nr:NADP-dependent oxidoreductase [Nocardioides sp. WS12]
MNTSQQIVLAARPHGHVNSADFRHEEAPVPPVEEGGIEIESLLISIDPAIRGWLDDRPSYLPPVAIGAPIRALGIARVTASRNDEFPPGTIVRGFVGWQQRQVIATPAGTWQKLDPAQDVPLEHHLGILGMTGLTAWAGVNDILQPQLGHTVLVSGASGAVGTVAVQLAKHAGAYVIGIAGGAEKCAMVTSLGADAVIDRKDRDWPTQLKRAAPNGIDRLFENAGGPMFESAINLLNDHARIALCGLIDGYNLEQRPAGPSNFGMLLTKRVLTQGFIVLDYMDRANEVEAYLANLIASGQMRAVQTVLSSLDQLPDAFIESFTNGHPGKLIVDLQGKTASERSMTESAANQK